MNFLKILPLSRQRVQVLFEIYAEREDYLRNVARRLNMNPSLAFSILHKLCSAQFLIKRTVGKEVQYSLNHNRDYELVVRLLEEYNLEKILDNKKIKALVNLLMSNKELIKSCQHIYLFGSAITGEKPHDIDILFVNEDINFVGRTCRELSSVIGIEVNPLIYTKKKFQQELTAEEPLLDSIVHKVRNRAVIK